MLYFFMISLTIICFAIISTGGLLTEHPALITQVHSIDL
ncbi:hypothetical protein DDI_3990 [Dickeya dianthicola RNS04.9]|nr:hypothetical protein DDI_3990 [Dickeya dianthicola RNS04.9]